MEKEQILEILNKHIILDCVITSNHFEDIAEELSQLDEWVSASKRYPQHKQEVIMDGEKLNGERIITSGQYWEAERFFDHYGIEVHNVIKWQPIPPLPEKKGGEG